MTIDTNIVIGYLNGDPQIVKAIIAWRREGRVLILPTVAETEILAFSGWSAQELRAAEQFLEENFTSINFDRPVARIAADIRRKMKIKFPDAAIAATALYTQTPVVTRNQRDFQKISGINIISI